MAAQAEPRPLSISLLAVPEASAAVLYSFCEVFAAVGTLWEEVTGTAPTGRRMRPQIVAEHAVPLTCAFGLPVIPHAGFAEGGAADVVIVTDLSVELGEQPRGRWPAASAWLRGQYEAGATVTSVCTGSLLLAEAGLLDGREATTHWAARELFATSYPAVRLVPERILALAGPGHRIVTSGGQASWAELALYLIARFCGRDEAVHIAKLFLLGDRSDGQLPFAAMTRPRRHDDAVIADCQAWIAEHYAAPSPVTRMAERARLATRTFKRRFRAATGYTPIAYVQTLRIEEAKQLLETTASPADAVGASVGYRDPAAFRRTFKRLTGITPARYRQRFRGIGAPD